MNEPTTSETTIRGLSPRITLWILLVSSLNLLLTFEALKDQVLIVAIGLVALPGLLCLVRFGPAARFLLALAMTILVWFDLAMISSRVASLLSQSLSVNHDPVMDYSFLLYALAALPVALFLTYLVYRSLDRRSALAVALAMILTLLPPLFIS